MELLGGGGGGGGVKHLTLDVSGGADGAGVVAGDREDEPLISSGRKR
jgi:hypothetical protein